MIWFPVKEDKRLELEHDKEMGWLLIKLEISYSLMLY